MRGRRDELVIQPPHNWRPVVPPARAVRRHSASPVKIAGADGSAAPSGVVGAPVVYVVDDDAEVRDMIVGAARRLGFDTEAFVDVTSFLRQVDTTRPGCLLLDAHLPEGAALDAQRELAARKASLVVIATLGHLEIEHVVQVMRAGAYDILQKPLHRERLEHTVRQAVERDIALHEQRSEGDEVRRRIARLTRRERQVLELVIAGLSSKAIAAELGLQEKTVEVYRSNINVTMKARNAVELVRLVSQADR